MFLYYYVFIILLYYYGSLPSFILKKRIHISYNIILFLAADEMQAKTEKIKSLKSVKKEVGKLKYKPLTGKVFYLDIPSNVISEKIGKDLKDLGGVN
uniref:Uncharacterized protein n=1 Tax=Meleagris gallopavo TaxID=9103 RepID=A0A803Y8A4_MELGA